ncbi:type IV pilin [Halomicroarcula sp. GCM10025709]|uniref:type IV pilin n=1 Tax=Haloarcula TaxID=2237 RepID=UPI0024C4326A|nr:type IV pilin [Halomicroarcula sp. YJ-61-S]
MGRSTERGVSPVVSTVLLVAVVVILASTVSVVAFGFTSQVDEPAPVVAQSSGQLVRDVTGGTDQIVNITHEAGDTIQVANIEVAVDASDACGKRGRLVDLPDNAVGFGSPDQIEGDDIFDDYSPDGGALDPTTGDTEFSAGDTIRFRLTNGACPLADGDRITVRIVHTPSGAVVVEQTLTAS